METIIKVLDNLDIDLDGTIYQEKDLGYYVLYTQFIKKQIPFKSGATIVKKHIGRPISSTRVQKTLRIEKKHVEDLNTVVKGLNMSDRILEKINTGDAVFKIEDIPISLMRFWIEWFDKNDKK